MGRDRRRQPQRVPLTRDIGNKARIRKRIDSQHYMIDIGSRVGSPAIGFYIGSLVLSEGELVLVTWREESDLYDIVGPVRKAGQLLAGFIGVGFEEVSGGAGQYMHILAVDTDGTLGDPIADPATQPTAEVERIEFSHNNQWVAIVYDDQLSIYEWPGVLGARLANATLPDARASVSVRLGLAWNANDTLLGVAHSDSATGDGFTVYTWDGAILTEAHNQTLPPNIFDRSGTACDWHPTNPNRVVVGEATLGFSIIVAYTWDGATLTEDDKVDQAIGQFIFDIEWRPDGGWIGVAYGSTPGAAAIVWNEGTGTFGARVTPASAPPNLVSEGVAWSADGSHIVIANGSADVVGYIFDGTFGSRILGAMVGVNPIANDVAGDPAGGFFAFAVETTSVGGIYVITMAFDGAAWTDVDSRASGGSLHIDGIAVGIPFGSVVPTEQLDASEITYDPGDDADWAALPDDVAEALDELADILTTHIAATITFPAIVDLPMNSFVASIGSPTYAQVGTNYYAWELDASVIEGMVYSFIVPPDYSSGGVFKLYYTMASAVADEVNVGIGILERVEGENFDAGNTSTVFVDDTVQNVADELGVVEITPIVTYAAGDRVRIIIARNGAAGTDNATGDMWLLGAEFRYTAALP